MAVALAVVGLSLACALWVVVQRQSDRLLPGNPGVDRDCKGCPQPCDEELAAQEVSASTTLSCSDRPVADRAGPARSGTAGWGRAS